MVDYIRDEEEQAERIKEWWQKYGIAAVIVIVLAVGSLLGWRQWQEHSAGESGKASVHYETMTQAMAAGNDDQLRSAANTLIEDYDGSAYADIARLALARLAVLDGDLNSAAELLGTVADDPAVRELEYTARLRLARVQVGLGDLDAANEQISRTFPKAWQGQALELKGDIASARENWDAARAAYGDALEALDEGASRDRVQMKLDDLKSQS
ncbi:YfgM family protein [Alloalcanivorax gelatiniphagus]|uniref:Ancillary SecYEG translocon subunit n=1 Tax=Alloalcanivorax gelatiniphagus TaxID=1194167 RepID=A0ABY2XKP6_9GAMM|nr:tetratricopeptide repeat protein [Alloalcanivorax gelatiniphagus]TMW12102.1 tetratricopeptide repeat protein [Alloalcanivorax gelatiniphagus]